MRILSMSQHINAKHLLCILGAQTWHSPKDYAELLHLRHLFLNVPTQVIRIVTTEDSLCPPQYTQSAHLTQRRQLNAQGMLVAKALSLETDCDYRIEHVMTQLQTEIVRHKLKNIATVCEGCEYKHSCTFGTFLTQHRRKRR